MEIKPIKDPTHYEILTIDEVAKILRVSKTKAYELAGRGLIPHIRYGKSIRFRRYDIEKFIDNSVIISR